MNERGFTLIELVVAIAVLGVVMVIALPAINTFSGDNQKKKYVAYEKTLKSAAKLYTDAYDEDLFGYKNTGCQKVKIDELEAKKLIEKIPLKGIKCDNPEKTFVYVYKDKNANHAYYSSIKCIDENDKPVYENVERNIGECKIEDGKGPEIRLVNNITFNPPKPSDVNRIDLPFNNNKTGYGTRTYTPDIDVIITDSGVGIKPGYQHLKYQWFKNGSEFDGVNNRGTISGLNPSDYYVGSINAKVPIPTAAMNANTKDAKYTLKVNGTLVDINNNVTRVNNLQPPYNDDPGVDTAYDFESNNKCPNFVFKQQNGTNASPSSWYNTNRNKITMYVQPVTGIDKFNAKEYRLYYQSKAKNSDSFGTAYSNFNPSTVSSSSTSSKAVGTNFDGKMRWKAEYYKKNSTVNHTCNPTDTFHFDHNNPKLTVNVSGETGKAVDGGTGYKNSITFNSSCTDVTSSPHLVYSGSNKGTSFSKKFDDRVSSKTFSIKCLDQASNQDTYSKTFRIIKYSANCSKCGVKTYNTCRHSSFGCELHKRSSVCTCNTWKSCRIKPCGCQTYKTKKVKHTGRVVYVLAGNKSCTRYSNCDKSFRHEGGTSRTTCTCTRVWYTTEKTNTCETWKSCRHSDCGCSLYNRCNAAPCERYYAKAKSPCSCKEGNKCWY